MSNTTTPLLDQLDKLYRHSRQGSIKTRARYLEAMKRFCFYLGEHYHLGKLANLAPKHVESYILHLQQRGLSAATIKTDLAAIRFWHDCMGSPKHALPGNDALALERRRFGQTDRSWSPAEFHKMIARCWREGREDYAAILCLARYAGLRIHECFRIDTATARQALEACAITIKGKGGKIRTVPINETIAIELRKLLELTPPGHKLFVPPGGKTHLEIGRLQQFILRHRRDIQSPEATPLTFHGLRYTYAQEQHRQFMAHGLSRQQANQKVSRLLGHEREDVTNIYLAGKGGENHG